MPNDVYEKATKSKVNEKANKNFDIPSKETLKKEIIDHIRIKKHWKI